MILSLILAYIFINRIELEASDYLCRLKLITSEFKAVHQGVFV
ncbi:hypothetical protein BSF42_09960 [Flavobacterium sp. ACN6]|nr:hypothetical protein BSF42_09960 [Flavobacterium sp. ACN6]